MPIVERDRRPRQARRVAFRDAALSPTCPEWLALDARLEADHLARAIARGLSRLDLSGLRRLYAGKGSPAYPPESLLAAVLFEVQRGHHCPAEWHRHAKESDPVRWLLRGLRPSRSCWYQFRDRLGPELLALAQQAVRGAIAAGLTPADRGAIDGTLLAANASRHKLLDRAALTRRRRQLREAVAGDGRGEPPGAAPRWLAPTAAGRRRQAERYRRAGAEMARRQARNRRKRASKRAAADRIVISASGPEAALGRDKEKVFRPLYNVQLLDDLDSPLVLGWLVAAQPNDAGLLGPVLRQAREGLGVTVRVVLADAGYAGGADLAEAKGLGAAVYAPWQANDFSGQRPDEKKAPCYGKERFKWLGHERAYECPQGQRLAYRGSSVQQRSGTERIELQLYQGDRSVCAGCAARARCTPGKGARTISRSEHEPHVEELRERMRAEEARRLYKLRKQTVELANADMKGHRRLRRLSGRGRERAAAQVGLVVLAHNLIALDALQKSRQAGGPPRQPLAVTRSES